MFTIEHWGLVFLCIVLHSECLLGASISGRIIDENNAPLPGSTILIQGTTKGSAADIDGYFTIDDVEFGEYTLEISSLGYIKSEIKITIDKANTELNIRLEVDNNILSEVLVSEKSESRRLSENPIQIASIDLTKLQSESSDVVAVLDRTAGVRVRQSGGLGSQTNIQLNGLTGRAVRTYYDGVPLELLGGGLQINNIPVNSIERIDVYKGVMPVHIGTDALAGGINIVSKQMDFDYLDASYQFGSFNTHIGTLNASKTLGDKLLLSVSSFYNYSDNNYTIRAKQRTANFKEETVAVDRFHSSHQSSMVTAKLGLSNVSWADRISYTISYNQRFDEIQHGIRIGNRAVGEADLENNVFMQSIAYQKTFFENKLGLDYFGNYSISNEIVDDSTTNVYNWFGEVVSFNAQGMEVLSRPSLREGRTEAQIHRLNAYYNINNAHSIRISSFLSDQDITGEDPLAIKVNGIDPNTVPAFLTRSISGISYESTWFKDKLESILFGKYYYYKQELADFRQASGDRVFDFTQEDNEKGYGLGLKYTFAPNLFVRASYEQAIRIPTSGEVFGNFLTIEPNFTLRPEKSKNLNVGAYFKREFSNERSIAIDATWFLRDQSDLIRLEAGRNENDPAQFINEAEADASGIEVVLNITPIRNFDLSASYTYQEVLKDGEQNATNTNGIGNPIPNIPSNFYNLSTRYSFSNPLANDHTISVFAYYTFVDEFDLIFQNTRNPENIIPAQNQLDVGMSYILGESGFVCSLQADNVLDEEVFDNFRVPKPGRNISLKIRYTIQ